MKICIYTLISLLKDMSEERAKSPEEPKVAKMDEGADETPPHFMSSGEEEEPEPDIGETRELMIGDRAAVVGLHNKFQCEYRLVKNGLKSAASRS